ncbi:hypothetical protein P7C71_g1493, partial [Lecanoromycetidae sp. Uapishka_2]
MTPSTRSMGKGEASKSSKSEASKKSKTSESIPSTDKTSSSDDPVRARSLMETYDLWIDHKVSGNTKKGKEILKAAKDLITKERLSPTKPETLERFMEKREKYKLSNEATFIDVIWWILVRDFRQVKESGVDIKSIQEKEELIFTKYWDKDFLLHRRDQEFERGRLPTPNIENDETLAKLLGKVKGMKNPKPDLAYGLDKDAFSYEEQYVNDANPKIADLSKGIYHPFFIAEFKSAKGAMIDAENQACRGGAAIMNTLRQLKDMAKNADKDHGHDTGSYVFSLTIMPDQAKINVHWAEMRTATKIVYHMHKVQKYDLEDEASVTMLRVAINNILDWGVVDRKVYLKGLLRTIYKLDMGLPVDDPRS